jgi:predicted DNA-binding transcriptional regulator YafY
MLDQIAAAIRGRNLIAFCYDGENRLVEPHACGYTAKGKPSFRGYQQGGGTTRVDLGWKLFSCEKIEGLQVLALTFDKPRDGFAANDKQLPQLVAQLELVA